MRNERWFGSTGLLDWKAQASKLVGQNCSKSDGAAARNSTTAGVDMRLALTYCLLKIPAKTGNPSSFLPSDSDEAVVGLDIFVGGFKLWSAPLCVTRGN
jgi:hypothetical protein